MKEKQKQTKSYVGWIFLIPFVMTLLGMLLYNQFPLYDSFWYSGAQIISFFFVSFGTIMLMTEVLRRKKLDEN